MSTATTNQLPSIVRHRLEQRGRLAAPGRSEWPGLPRRIPLVGRSRELSILTAAMERVEQGTGSTVMLRGSRGVGKTRLGEEVADLATERGWAVLAGRAYPAERLVPFALFSDAFVPLLGGLDESTLSELAPGGLDALYSLLPPLGVAPPEGPGRFLDSGERQTRVFWHFTGMLGRIARERPLLLLLEDLDFADSSSIHLLHFIGRQCPAHRLLVIGQYTGWERRRRQALVSVEQSLQRMDAGLVIHLEPLTPGETRDFIQAAMPVEDAHAARLADLAWRWTRGNPFFLQGTLRGLAETLENEDDRGQPHDPAGRVVPPHSIRDALLVWLSGLSEGALEMTRLLAVLGVRASDEMLRYLSGLDTGGFNAVMDELVRHEVLDESESHWSVVYDFRHPLIRETLRNELSLADKHAAHRRLAEALERYYGDRADEHADQLAYHFGQSGPSMSRKVVRYLVTAGQAALERHADAEAAEYLGQALERLQSPRSDTALGEDQNIAVVMTLARAKRRLGEMEESMALWSRALGMADTSNDPRQSARIYREMGFSCLAAGYVDDAIVAFERGLSTAATVADVPLMVRIQLAQCVALQSAGRPEQADEVLQDALSLASRLDDPGLLGRAHGAVVRLNIWTGDLTRADEHAREALELARRAQDRPLEFWSHWALAAQAGLVGRTDEMRRHLAVAREVADELGSPWLDLEASELEVELAWADGRWDEALTVGERAVHMARTLNQRSVLARLLVWVAFVHLGRSELDVADALTREAWDVSEAGRASQADRGLDVHAVVPAHIGRAAYHLASGDWEEALDVAEAGLALADRTGYIAWALHHLLPIMAEAAIHLRDLDRARLLGRRLRSDAEALQHPLGLAWADACDAVLVWLDGDVAEGARALRSAAEGLESIPITYEGTRLRRQLAGRLAELGDPEGALEELERVHRTLVRLGARNELERARQQFLELGREPPQG